MSILPSPGEPAVAQARREESDAVLRRLPLIMAAAESGKASAVLIRSLAERGRGVTARFQSSHASHRSERESCSSINARAAAEQAAG